MGTVCKFALASACPLLPFRRNLRQSTPAYHLPDYLVAGGGVFIVFMPVFVSWKLLQSCLWISCNSWKETPRCMEHIQHEHFTGLRRRCRYDTSGVWSTSLCCASELSIQNCQFNSVSWNSSGFLIGACKFHLCDLFTFTRWWLNTDVWSHRVLSHTDVLFVQCVFWCSCSFWQPMQCRRFVPTPCHHNVSAVLFSV